MKRLKIITALNDEKVIKGKFQEEINTLIKQRWEFVPPLVVTPLVTNEKGYYLSGNLIIATFTKEI